MKHFPNRSEIKSNGCILAQRLSRYIADNFGKMRPCDIESYYFEKDPGLKLFLRENNTNLEDFIYDFGESESLFWIASEGFATIVINGIFLLKKFVRALEGILYISEIGLFYDEYFFMESIISYKKGLENFVFEYRNSEEITYVKTYSREGDYLTLGRYFENTEIYPQSFEPCLSTSSYNAQPKKFKQESSENISSSSSSRKNGPYKKGYNIEYISEIPLKKDAGLKENKAVASSNNSWNKPIKKNWFNLKMQGQLQEAPKGKNPLGKLSKMDKNSIRREENKMPRRFLKYMKSAHINISDFKLQNSHFKELLTSHGPPPKTENFMDYYTIDKLLELHKYLLYVEEVQMMVDISSYDLEDTIISKEFHSNMVLYRINVPGLAEKRPSVLRGDKLIIKMKHNDGKTGKTEFCYSFAWFINLDHVLVSLHKNFQNEFYFGDVHFSYTRTPLLKMHEALDTFRASKPLMRLLGNQNFFDSKLSVDIKGFSTTPNELQRRTISVCLSDSEGSQDTIIAIFGPPGTGKTSTIIEIILQIINKNPSSKILACTPSNEAADLICIRLLEYQAKSKYPSLNIMRIVARLRDPKLLPEAILKNCNLHFENGVFLLPSKEIFLKCNVIVTTNISASYLKDLNLAPNTFSHIFIDEAGEALLSEALVPLTFKGIKTSVILAGDPKQLGPIVRSPVCIAYGMEISLLESLIRQRSKGYDQYKVDPVSLGEKGVFHLVENYRANRFIMEIYNELFYHGYLISRGDEAITNLFLGWGDLKNKNVPVLFRHVEGLEERDYDSPSWFNNAEKLEVFKLVMQLLQVVKEEDIGIISPYRKQRDKIKQYFYGKKEYADQYGKIRVGTTESFQGSEKKIIIVSCVRSQVQNFEHDKKFNLGFVNSPKRINVAISRAQSLLIILGNAYVLSSDPLFKSLLQIIHRMGAFDGPNLDSIKYDPLYNNDIKSDPLGYIHPRNQDLEWREIDNM